MKVLAIIGTNRRKGNIAGMCDKILQGASENGHEAERINLYDYRIEFCRGCWACAQKGKCVIEDDFEKIYCKVEAADVIVLGTPVYWGGVTAIMKAFFDRHTGYAMYQPEGINQVYKKSLPEKLGTMKKELGNFGPKKEFGRKKFILAVALTLPQPSAWLSGDLPNTMKSLSTYVHNLKGKVMQKIVFTDTLFRFRPGKKDKLMEKAYRIGRRIR